MSRRERCVDAALAALLPLLLVLPVTLRGGTFFRGTDTHYTGIGFRTLAARAFAEGRLPLYTETMFGGYPIHGDPHLGWLYPPAWVGMAIGGALGMHVEFTLHLMLAAVGACLLLRAHGRSRSEALLAAAAFALSGPLVYWLRHYNFSATAAWLPWVALAARSVVLRGGWRPAVLLGGATAAAFLAGSPQVFVYVCALAGAYGVALACRERALVRSAGWAVPAVGVFALVVAAQLVSTARLVAEGARAGGMSFAAASAYSSQPAATFNLWLPDVVHGDAGGALGFGYVGLLPWMLLPFALGRRPGRLLAAAAGVLLLSMLAWGENSVVWRAAFEHLGFVFGRFRNPSRMWFVIGAAVALGGAAGLPRFVAWVREPGGRRAALAGLVLAAFGLALGLWFWRAGGRPLLGKRVVVAAVVVAGACATTFVPGARRRAAALVLVAVADLFVFSLPYVMRENRRLDFDEPVAYDVARRAAAVAEESGPARIALGTAWVDWQAVTTGLGVRSVSGVGQLHPRRSARLFNRLNGGGAGRGGYSGAISHDAISDRARDLFHVRALGGAGGHRDVARGFEVLEPALPLVQMHPGWRVAEDEEEELSLLADPQFWPLETVLVSEEPDLDATVSSGHRAEVVHWGEGELTVRVEEFAGGVLRTPLAYVDGWRATIDGEGARILRVNHAFVGVVVPGGEHVVEFRYEAPGLRFLLALCAAGWLLIAAAGATGLRSGREA